MGTKTDGDDVSEVAVGIRASMRMGKISVMPLVFRGAVRMRIASIDGVEINAKTAAQQMVEIHPDGNVVKSEIEIVRNGFGHFLVLFSCCLMS